MAWEEQRAKRAQAAAGAAEDETRPFTPAPSAASGGMAQARSALARYGAAVAVGLSALALILSGIALASSGGNEHHASPSYGDHMTWDGGSAGMRGQGMGYPGR